MRSNGTSLVSCLLNKILNYECVPLTTREAACGGGVKLTRARLFCGLGCCVGAWERGLEYDIRRIHT